jgi:hypothetical protein
MGEQAGVLRLELLAVLQGQMERGSGVERDTERQTVSDCWPKTGAKEPGSQLQTYCTFIPLLARRGQCCRHENGNRNRKGQVSI